MKMLILGQSVTKLLSLTSIVLRAICVGATTPSMSKLKFSFRDCHQLTITVDVASAPSNGYDQELSGFLSYRNMESSPILQRATVIFQTKLSNSTPLQDAALELLKTCKSAEDLSTPTNSADSIKDAAKSIYAIKAALISLSSASVRGPSSCDGFGVQPYRFTFLAAVKGNKDQNSSPSVNERTRCVGELWKTDNSWTSYSNGLQDANILCQVPSLENAQRAILDLLSDMNEIIPAWLISFDETQKAHLEFMREQKARATDLNELQRRHREGLEDSHEAVKSTMSMMMANTKEHVDAMTEKLREELVTAGTELEQLEKAVGHYIFDFLMLKDDQKRIFQEYQSTFTDAVAVQSRGMHEVEDTVQSVIKSLNHVYGGLEEQVRSISAYLGIEMRDIFQLQDQIKDGQAALLGKQLEAIQHQMEISAFSIQLKGEIADIATAVSSVNGLLDTVAGVWAGRISAIGRAIAALLISSVLFILIGYRGASAVAGCTVLVYLLSPFLRHFADGFCRVSGYFKTLLTSVGREFFVLSIQSLNAVVSFSVSRFDASHAPASVKYYILVSAIVVTAYTVLYIRSNSKGKRETDGMGAVVNAVDNSGRTFLHPRRLSMKPSIQTRSCIEDRFERAATLPPQRKSRWESLHKAQV